MFKYLQEIRNRHWLQVMSVTNSTFQLEANYFKLEHLLDIGLIKLVRHSPLLTHNHPLYGIWMVLMGWCATGTGRTSRTSAGAQAGSWNWK